MQGFNDWMVWLNGVLWHNVVLYIVLATGILFTIWTRFGQATALTHGWKVIRGQYDDPADPGAINHFQALSAALSATVGLGNIGGVALAIALGGPGAVFWMWVVGLVGMALKMTEVTLSMLYRNTDDPDNPHGGPMWVVKQGIARMNPRYAWAGSLVGALFCITLLISTITGGNMFQAWNVGEITESYFGIPSVFTGIVLAIVVALVIIGGIKRIGNVAGHLVPVMMALYILGGLFVLAVNLEHIPSMFALIIQGAFSSVEASGAFIGGTAGYAFLFGMKRALFSNEAGQGSSPIAHSAAKTPYPVREGIVALLEPMIDTIIVCTMTALVIVTSGAWLPMEGVETPTGVALTMAAFDWGLPGGAWLVTFGTVFFTATTILGWGYYSERCLEFLVGVKGIKPFRLVWVAVVVIGAVASFDLVWTVADILNGLMAIPNLISLLLLSGTVFQLTRRYDFSAARFRD